MVEHFMRLNEDPFERMKSGVKKVEVRLNDSKRGKVRVGDEIVFSKVGGSGGGSEVERIRVKVVALKKFNSFKELFDFFGAEKLGLNGGGHGSGRGSEARSGDYRVNEFVESCYDIYSEKQEKGRGVLGIEVEMV